MNMYQCHQRYVYKIRFDGQMLVDMMCFLDNGRATDPSDYICWDALQSAGKNLAAVGVNTASKKIHSVGQDDEVYYAGTIVLPPKGQVVVCVSDKK